MDEHDDQVKARIFNRIFNTGPRSKDFLDCLVKKALASGNERLLTELSRRKADIDEFEAEEKKDDEVTDRIRATGDVEAMMARMKELEVIRRKRYVRIFIWERVFRSKKQCNS